MNFLLLFLSPQNCQNKGNVPKQITQFHVTLKSVSASTTSVNTADMSGSKDKQDYGAGDNVEKEKPAGHDRAKRKG